MGKIKNNNSTSMVKSLERYRRKLRYADIVEIPEIVKNLYSFIINKNVVQDDRFIKNELCTSVSLMIQALKIGCDAYDILRLIDFFERRLLAYFSCLYQSPDKITLQLWPEESTHFKKRTSEYTHIDEKNIEKCIRNLVVEKLNVNFYYDCRQLELFNVKEYVAKSLK